MTPTDTTRVLALVAAACPAQAIGEHTAEAWHLVLGHLDYADAAAAVVEVAKREPFIAASAIVQEARRLKAARLAQVSPLAVPDADPDDPRAYAAALRAGRMREPDDLKPVPIGDALRRVLEAARPVPTAAAG